MSDVFYLYLAVPKRETHLALDPLSHLSLAPCIKRRRRRRRHLPLWPAIARSGAAASWFRSASTPSTDSPPSIPRNSEANPSLHGLGS